jgi:hypothetical protein
MPDELRPLAATTGASGTKLLLTAALLLVVGGGLIVCLALYRRDWNSAREGWRVETSPEPYLQVRAAFLADVEAGRLDAAYQAATPSFRGLVGRKKFEAAASCYRAFRQRPGARNEAGPNPLRLTLNLDDLGPPTGSARQRKKDDSPRGYSVFASDYWTAADGARLRVSVTVVQEPDSFFYRRPPPIRVDSFAVEYVDSQGNTIARDRE